MNLKRYFGEYGGAFVPDLLVEPLNQLNQSLKKITQSKTFQKEYLELLQTVAGRPTPLTEAKNLTRQLGGARIFLKREDLLHTGAHKINNSLGQCLLAKHMGKTRIIAETGAGQHGLATATSCAALGLQCTVYMGAIDIQRQKSNVDKMELLGATIVSVEKGSQTLKEAINEAMRDWAKNYENSFYCLGSALGPFPYPEMVINFQRVIGKEAKKQLIKKVGKLPKAVIACVGGGSNAMGIFKDFILEKSVELLAIEGGGVGKLHAARFKEGRPGVLHGAYTYLLQNKEGQVLPTHSISAGLDYPAVSPALANLHDQKRVQFCSASDQEALKAFKLLCKLEGIIPALESSHALAHVMKIAAKYPKSSALLVCLSGRGDKDLPTVMEAT